MTVADQPGLPAQSAGSERNYRQDLLDEALDESFSASDALPLLREAEFDLPQDGAVDSVPLVNQEPWPSHRLRI
jgi:hypothetical protein